jgi:N-acetylneuraminic acid mutarotase
VYDVLAASWSTLPDQLGVTNRSNAAAFAINGILYVTGGYDNNYNSLNSTIALNTSVASASLLRFQANTVPAKPVSAGDCGGVSIAGFGYVFAGFSSVPADGFCYPLNSIEQYSPLSNSWTLLSPPSPMQNRGDPAYAVVSDLLFVMGGEAKLNPAVDCFDGSSLSFPINSVEYFNVSSGNWTPVSTDSLPVSRFRFSGNTANSRIYNIGGQAGEIITNSSADPVNPYEDSGYWPVVSVVEALDVSALVNGTSHAVRQREGSAGMMLMAVMASVIGVMLL